MRDGIGKRAASALFLCGVLVMLAVRLSHRIKRDVYPVFSRSGIWNNKRTSDEAHEERVIQTGRYLLHF